MYVYNTVQSGLSFPLRINNNGEEKAELCQHFSNSEKVHETNQMGTLLVLIL